MQNRDLSPAHEAAAADAHAAAAEAAWHQAATAAAAAAEALGTEADDAKDAAEAALDAHDSAKMAIAAAKHAHAMIEEHEPGQVAPALERAHEASVDAERGRDEAEEAAAGTADETNDQEREARADKRERLALEAARAATGEDEYDGLAGL